MAGLHGGDVSADEGWGLGWPAGLWQLVQTGRLVITDLSTSAVDRSARLMDKSTDTPMDLADATLVALAEETGQRKIFSLDSDFHVYRIRGRQRFEVVPAHEPSEAHGAIRGID